MGRAIRTNGKKMNAYIYDFGRRGRKKETPEKT
jgi:hypothetical protein